MALFKQMTCDTCYRPLANIGRHNRYYFCKIEDFERISKTEFIRNQAKYSNPYEPRFNYDTSECSQLHDYVYCYKFDNYPQANGYSTWFCSNECALEAAIRMNCILFYYDENDRSVAMITPQLKEINREIKESPYTPLLMMEWPADQWLQQPKDFQDLSMYGSNNVYPTLSLSKVNLVVPNRKMVSSLRKMFTTPSFAKNYFGNSSSEIMKAISEMIPDNYDESAQIDFGRRAEISWFITDKQNCFVGFIHITQKYKALPYKWVLEFGISSEYQGQGIMSEVLPKVVSFARKEGCDEPIYAVSEDFNIACHRLFRKFPNVQEIEKFMIDQYAGGRMMHIFIIPFLEAQSSCR